ncbi:MAG: tRNA uridine-5-carboxymethylaminomethyl(34) synthesis GTPase MnmE [Lachnospiraceae bacterium]|nr:tRNA uridine-5-carboxymethylaminomethyl(34) synthesis GTPase MnmE [Lachnospiraceae bacterium]
MFEDTIAAIATAMSTGGISIIRISGPDSISIADRILVTKSGKHFVGGMASHTVHYGFVTDQDGEIIDEVLTSIFFAPKSYTGETVVEISCHGGIVVSRRILERVLTCGARLAEPGEFSKRAFLNGRIDLSQAEAVMDLITSESDAAAKASVHQLTGLLSRRIGEIREKILYETAHLEAAMDDPEHYDLTGYADAFLPLLNGLLSDIKQMMDSYSAGKLLREGISTVILGQPNTGKSSLLNLLLGQERAIVSDISGTTRDTLEETLSLGDVTLHLIDTAGLRDADDPVEQIGVKRALSAAAEAQLILYVIDSSLPLSDEDVKRISEYPNAFRVVILNKNDLQEAFVYEDAKKIFSDIPVISFSSKTGDGLLQLQELIRDSFYQGAIRDDGNLVITRARHMEALSDAYHSLELVKDAVLAGMPEDLYTVDLMNAYRSLGLIIGEEIEDDLADKIFSEFCMGK